MKKIKLSLVDTDYRVQAKTEIPGNGSVDPVEAFFRKIHENLVPGQTAHLEVDGLENRRCSFEISAIE